jgi:hypothetical protein
MGPFQGMFWEKFAVCTVMVADRNDARKLDPPYALPLGKIWERGREFGYTYGYFISLSN